jgi:hypothetical protein
MASVADEDGDLPGVGSARGEGLGEPLADDAADGESVSAGLLLFKLGRGE